MTYHTSFLVAATTLFPATAAFADVTPQEVWEQFQVSAQVSGQTWTAGNMEQNGDTLIAQDVSITMPGFSDFMTVSGAVPKLLLQQLDDGTVKITTPDSVTYSVSVDGKSELGIERMYVNSTMTMDNVSIASGTADDLSVEIMPGTITYVTQKQVKDGVAIVPEQTIILLGVKGLTSQKTSGSDVASTWNMTAEAVTMVSNGTTDEMTMESSYKMAPLTLTADFTASLDASDAPLGFLETLNGTGNYSIGNMSFETSTGTAEQLINMTGESAKTTVGVAIVDGSLTYTGTSANTEMVVSGSAIPFPQVDLGLEKASFALTVPFLASDDAEAFGLKLGLENLRLPEIAWMMLDPAGQIAHDPATLKLDISGDMVLDVNLLNPTEILASADNSLPVFPKNLALNELFLSIAGATLTGKGEAMFIEQGDMEDTKLPFKTAEATLSLTGGTALIDTLAQTGLVPPQMSTTAKLMLGMFARPGAGDDSYITDIELDEAGTLTLNGQPMPF